MKYIFFKNLLNRKWKDNAMQAIYPTLVSVNTWLTNNRHAMQEINVGQYENVFTMYSFVFIPHSAATLNNLRHLHQQALKCSLEVIAPEELLRIFYQH